MGLTILHDLMQGTEEWERERRGMITASVVGKLIASASPDALEFACPECASQPGEPCLSLRGSKPMRTVHGGRSDRAKSAPSVLRVADNDTSRAVGLRLTGERISGNIDLTHTSGEMWRGVLDEPVARDLYSEHLQPVEECGFMVRDDWGFCLGYSPDGLVGDDGLIEIKSRTQKVHLETILAGSVPPESMAQLQAGLLISGRSWIDYVSYCGGMALWTKRVTPDPEWQAAIIAAATAFEATATDVADRYWAAVKGMPATTRIDHYQEIV